MIKIKMKKVKSIMQVYLDNLIPNNNFFQHIDKVSFIKSFIYFVLLVIFFELISIGMLFLKFNPWRMTNLTRAFTKELNNYPPDLTVHIDKNLISTYNRPYFFWLNFENKKKLILVINETASSQDINNYKTLILLTGSEIVIKDKSSFSNLPLSSLGKITINKENIIFLQKLLNRIIIFMPLIYLLIFIILLLFIPFSILAILVDLIIVVAIFYFLFKFFTKKQINFIKIMQISFYAVTLPITLRCILNILFNTHPSRLSFFFLIFIFVFGALYDTYFGEIR